MPTQATGAATKRAPETQDKELTREERIIKHLPLVRAIASRVREGLPVQVELDDLAHAGVMGLFDAVDKYNPDKGGCLPPLRQAPHPRRDPRQPAPA